MASRTIFWVFGMTQPGIEPRSPGPLANLSGMADRKFWGFTRDKLLEKLYKLCSLDQHILNKMSKVYFKKILLGRSSKSWLTSGTLYSGWKIFSQQPASETPGSDQILQCFCCSTMGNYARDWNLVTLTNCSWTNQNIYCVWDTNGSLDPDQKTWLSVY